MTSNVSWDRVPVSSVALGIFDGPHATPKPAAEGPVFLGIQNITEDGRIDLSNVRHIAEEDYYRWAKRACPEPGDIVFTYEATLNRYAMIPEGFVGCLGRRVALIRPNPKLVHPRYLLAYFMADEWREIIARNVLSGSTVDRIPLTSFPEFEIALPPMSVQRTIASILSAYDDLVENNLRRIAILEEMAQAIYREWFVEFRYPGNEGATLVEPQHSPIPEGWLVVDAASVIERLKPETTYTETDVVSRGSVPVVDQSARELLGFHDGEPDFTATPAMPLMVFGDHTCRMKLLMEPFSVGPNVVPFTVSTALPALYAFYSLQDRVETREYKRHWNDLMRLKVVIPERSLVDGFCGTATPMVSLAGELSRENLVLKDMRDLVLPKLVSGEIDVETICQDRRIAN